MEGKNERIRYGGGLQALQLEARQRSVSAYALLKSELATPQTNDQIGQTYHTKGTTISYLRRSWGLQPRSSGDVDRTPTERYTESHRNAGRRLGGERKVHAIEKQQRNISAMFQEDGFARLTEIERQLIQDRYSVTDPTTAPSLRELAEKYTVPYHRVNRIINKAIKKYERDTLPSSSEKRDHITK